MSGLFRDRAEAGRLLAEKLRDLGNPAGVVLGLARGGVPVAFKVARSLRVPLDVLVVRKLGVPYQPELGMGAIGEVGTRVLNQAVLAAAGVDEPTLAAVEHRERSELERQVDRFRAGRPPVPLEGRTVILVDDGIATGITARAACQLVRVRGAGRVVLATPVAAPSSVDDLSGTADQVVVLDCPDHFLAVGRYYRDFSQVTDGDVTELLARAARRGPGEGGRGPAP